MPASRFSVMEIGCGQGYFWEFLRKHLGNNLIQGIGFDPALRQQKVMGNVHLIPNFASKALLPEYITSPLLLLSRHVIEHIEKPFVFMQSLLELTSAISTVALETPSVDWIINNNAYFDLNYEHCSLFTPNALLLLLTIFWRYYCLQIFWRTISFSHWRERKKIILIFFKVLPIVILSL
jgi:hypothetical protein